MIVIINTYIDSNMETKESSAHGVAFVATDNSIFGNPIDYLKHKLDWWPGIEKDLELFETHDVIPKNRTREQILGKLRMIHPENIPKCLVCTEETAHYFADFRKKESDTKDVKKKVCSPHCLWYEWFQHQRAAVT